MADPLWRQIAEDLRQKIESGELGADGQALPTELELRDRYNASRNTIRDAIKWLVTRNLVYTRSGQGTFVTRKIKPFVTRLVPADASPESASFATEVIGTSRTPLVSEPRVEILPAAGLPASGLSLSGDAMVISRHQQRLIDGVPYSRQTTFYPLTLAQRGADRLISAQNIDEGAVRYIELTLGIAEVGWHDQINARPPDGDEVTFFGLPDDWRIAVFEFIRTGFDESGTPLRTTVTKYPVDRNQFFITSGKVTGDAEKAYRRPASHGSGTGSAD
jgi:GntR family transcriptional regulator